METTIGRIIKRSEKRKFNHVERQSEISNIEKLTILRLRNVSRKECGIIVSDVE